MRLRRPAAIDVILGTLALAFGSLSLTYPFAHDQALYAYVAREWMQRGAIPYRDVFDHKTPGIYVVHAIAYLAFGDTAWGIRLLDLLGVIAMGLLVARIAAPRGKRPMPGSQGLGCLVMAVFHYGFFDYWNTAQSELWYSLLGLTATHQALRVNNETRAQIGAGLFSGLTLVMKPPGIWLVLVALILVLDRVREEEADRSHRSLLALARFLLAAITPIGLILSYFAAHHAVGAMIDVVVHANAFYVNHDPGVRSFGEVLDRFHDVAHTLFPLGDALLLGLVIQIGRGLRLGDRQLLRRYILAGACLAAALAAVVMQMKFYWLHWLVGAGPFALIAVNLHNDLVHVFRHRFYAAKQVVPAIAAALVITLFAVGYYPSTYWLEQQSVGLAKLTGRSDAKTFSAYFTNRRMYYFYGDMDDVSTWIRDHSTVDDTIVVRGFNPEIYMLAHRHYAGRFFWTIFLVEDGRAYRRHDYLAEEEQAFATTRPKFAVALSSIHEGIDSSEWHEARGYRVSKQFGAFTLLEHDSAR